MRLSFDCTPANCLHNPPPMESMATASAFANLDWSPESLEKSERSQAALSFSALDLTDCFYQYRWEKLSSFFCLDLRVRACEYRATSIWDEELET